MIAAFFGTRNAKFTEQVKVEIPFVERLHSALQNRPFILFLGIKLTSLLAFASILASKFFFVTVVMHQGVQIVGIFGAMQLVGQLGTIPLWLAYSKRAGKRSVVMVSTVMMIVFTASWFMSGPDESLWVYGFTRLFPWDRSRRYSVGQPGDAAGRD